MRKWGYSSFWLNSKGQKTLLRLNECNSPFSFRGCFSSALSFHSEITFPLKNLETTPLWTCARCSFYPPPMINSAVFFFLLFDTNAWVSSIFFLMCRETRKPQALFSLLEKAQPRIIHSLFYKGKVFDGVWGIQSARMKTRLQRKTEWEIGLFWSPSSKTYHAHSHKYT